MRLYHYNRQYNFGPESSFFCRFDKNAKHKPMSEFNFCGADIQLCSEEQREIAFTSERLGVDTHPEKTDRAVSQFTVRCCVEGRG